MATERNTTIELLRRMMTDRPEDWEVRVHLAELLVGEKQLAEARREIELGGTLPDNEGLRLRVAEVMLEADPDRALAILDGVIENNRACAQAYLNKSRLLIASGDRHLASRNYGAAVLIDPELSDSVLERMIEGDALKPIGAPSFPPADATANEERDEDFLAAEALIHSLDDSLGVRRPSFESIGGMEGLKSQLRMKMIQPLKHPEVFRRYKKSAGGGLLLYGPPGCGKTLLAQAAAGECQATPIVVSIPEILSRYVGDSEKQLAAIFETARRKAPSILFIDEIDALGVKRALAGEWMANLVNVLLVELDGGTDRNEGVFFLGATNMPWKVDPALRRPGRFDRVVFVPPPDAAARLAILEIHLDGIPQSKLDLKKLVAITRDFSGADLAAVVRDASEKALEKTFASDREVPVDQSMLIDAVRRARPAAGEWLETASNYAQFGNTSGIYDELADYLASRR